ncbi:uncharacterized protein LOC116361882 isoform X3 [Oncorhynchus kisutch]|nr:uncharacterized protein LOC116361882 isoform X3 [Oncorhynchus kisutch]XP_031672059.1 uncharacterized protein LOC116361882 isoform X3 [Oncorhynchus kisutch]XP_031672060.1 uncharacterized protein LOC116361882 isoform X3 [Oncorhynchus kisutch]XP_031672061.1 uncharacterized protein LOC116361882 isoform X3 [Oncorhynchus kisutch]
MSTWWRRPDTSGYWGGSYTPPSQCGPSPSSQTTRATRHYTWPATTESEVSGNDLTLIDLGDPIIDGDVMKEDREVERQTKLEEAVLETDIPTLSLEADGEIEMQEADLKTDGTSQSQEVEGESELDEAIVIPSQSQEEAKGESELNQVDLKTSTSTLTLEVEGESELNQVDLKTSTLTLTLEVEGESDLNQVDLKTSTSTLTLEVEGESVMQESDDVETAGPSQSQETERVAKAAVVTFTTMTRKAAASQTSLSRGKRSYPDLHTFVQDMKDGHWNLLSENMRSGMSRDEFSARCMDITNWVMESTSTVVVPALDLTMQIRLSDSSSSSGSGSNVAREVTSLGRSVRFSFRGGPSRRTSSRTTCSTQTPTPFPYSHSSMTSLLSVDEERYVSSPEGGDREMRHRPHSAPLSSVFGISEDSVFNMVQRGQSQSEIVLSSSWSRREKYRPVKIPTDTRFMMGIVELVMNLLNSRLAELMRSFSQGTLGPLSGSISASQQFAQEMLSMVSAKMYSHAIEHIAHGHKSPLELERELEAILGPLAGQVIVIIIDSIFKAKANGRNEGRATSPLTYFLTAISAEIQSLVVQRSASRPSTRLSNNDPLLNVSKSKVLRSVLLKMAELFGQGPSETCLVPLVQSQSNNSVCDWTLNAGTVHPSQFLSHNRMTEVSSDVVDLVLEVFGITGFLDSRSPSRPQSACSYNSANGAIDMRALAGDLVRQVSVKLRPFVSESQLSTMSMTDLSSSISDSTLKQLCCSSAVAAATVCQAIKMELENQRPTNLSARDLLSSLVESIEDMDISDILQGPSAILEEAAMIKHPEMSTSTIYRSLLLDSSLASSNMVTESIIFNSPRPSEENVNIQNVLPVDKVDILHGQPVEGYIVKDEQCITQVIQDAAVTYTGMLDKTDTCGKLSEVLSICVSAENIEDASSDLFGGIISDLHEVSEVNKTSMRTKSGRKMFWMEVSSGSQKIYTKTLDKLRKLFTSHLLTEGKNTPVQIEFYDTGLLVTETTVEVSPVQKTDSNTSSMSSAHQLTLDTCTKGVIKQVISVLRVETSKEVKCESMSNASFDFNQKLDSIISKLESLTISSESSKIATLTRSRSVASRTSNISIQSFHSAEFRATAKQIVREAILRAASEANCSLPQSMPSSTFSHHVVSTTEDIVNMIMQDLESLSQYTVEDADSFPLGEKKLQSQLNPRVVFDTLLDAAQTMYHRVKDRLNVFLSFPPVSVTTAKDVLDSTPVETLRCSKSPDTALVKDRSRPPSVRSEKPFSKVSLTKRSKALVSSSGSSTDHHVIDTCSEDVTLSMSVVSDTSLKRASPLHGSGLSASCEPLVALQDGTVAVSQEGFSKTAKKTLSLILNVIKCRLANSESSSVGQNASEECLIATNMLDSLLESLDLLPDMSAANEITRTECHTSNAMDKTGSQSALVSQQEINISDTSIIVKTIMDTLKTDDPEMTTAEENLDRLLSIEALQDASGNLIAKVHGLIQEITISRQLQSTTGHRSLSQPALPKPALRKLSKDDASELIYSFAQTSVSRLLGQCLGRPMPPTADRVLDQVIKLMTDMVMDSLTDLSKSAMEDVIVPRSVTPACSSYLDTSHAASDITHGVVADLNATEEFPARGLSPADVKADGMAHLPSARGEETKENRKWHFLPKIIKIPKIRIKLFKTKGEPKSHPEQDSLPTKRLRETRISQDAECEVLSTSPPKEALTTTLAPAPQESQSRKRPLIVRVLRAISRAVSKPFRKAFGKKN